MATFLHHSLTICMHTSSLRMAFDTSSRQEPMKGRRPYKKQYRHTPSDHTSAASAWHGWSAVQRVSTTHSRPTLLFVLKCNATAKWQQNFLTRVIQTLAGLDLKSALDFVGVTMTVMFPELVPTCQLRQVDHCMRLCVGEILQTSQTLDCLCLQNRDRDKPALSKAKE